MRLIGILSCLWMAITAVAGDAREELSSAARSLGSKANYAWVTTNLSEAKASAYPRLGSWDARGTMVVSERAFLAGDLVSKLQKLPGRTNSFPEEASVTNGFVVVDGRCALKSGGVFGCVIKYPDQWHAFASSRPPPDGYELIVANPPHLEVEDLLKASNQVSRGGDVFVVSMSGAGAKKFLADRIWGAVLSAEGLAKIFVSNSIPVKYELNVKGDIQTATFFGNSPGKAALQTSTSVLDIGTARVEVPPEARKALADLSAAKNPRSGAARRVETH
jgi:hypothetical protein